MSKKSVMERWYPRGCDDCYDCPARNEFNWCDELAIPLYKDCRYNPPRGTCKAKKKLLERLKRLSGNV